MLLTKIRKRLIYPDKSFYKTILLLSLPIVGQNFITMGVNLVDTFMIGKLGDTALSATSLATQFINVFQIFIMGLSMGASVLVTRFWGMKDKESVRKTATIMFRISFVLIALFTALTYFMPRFVMQIFTNGEAVICDGLKYLKYATWSFFFHGLTLNCTVMLRCVRKVHLPLIASLCSFAFNIGGNYVLIFGKLGFPRMGIAGASLATLISRVIEFLIIVGYFFVIDTSVGYRMRHLFKGTGGLLPKYIRVSIPVLISDGFLAFGNSAISMIIGRMGESFIAANAVVTVATRILTIFTGGVNQSSAVIVGNTLGEGKIKEVRSQAWAFFSLGLALGLIAGIIVLTLSPMVVAAYGISGETAQVAKQLLAAIAIVIVFDSPSNIMTKGVLRAGGDTRMLMIGDCIFLWCVSVPLGFLSGLVWRFSPFWVYFFLKAESLLKFVWCIFRTRSGKWLKKVSQTETKFDS